MIDYNDYGEDECVEDPRIAEEEARRDGAYEDPPDDWEPMTHHDLHGKDVEC